MGIMEKPTKARIRKERYKVLTWELGLAQQGKSENMARMIITTLNYNCAHLEFEKLGHYRSNFTMKWITFMDTQWLE